MGQYMKELKERRADEARARAASNPLSFKARLRNIALNGAKDRMHKYIKYGIGAVVAVILLAWGLSEAPSEEEAVE